MMNVKTSKAQSVKWQASLRSSSKIKQEAKSPSSSSSSSSSSIKSCRSPFVSQKTSRRVASSVIEIKNAYRVEAAKISSSKRETSKWTGNFILMVELRRKIISFRGLIDLPPLTGYLSITNMVMRTMKDLHKLCPEVVESSQLLDIRRADVDKLLEHFYNALKSIGDPWIDDHEWIIKSKYRNSVRKNLSDRLVEKVIAALDGLIKGMNERLNMTEIGNDEMKKKVSLQSKTCNNQSVTFMKQPITPRSVKKSPSKAGEFAISVSNPPRNVRMQTLVKLSPIDVKRLAIKKVCQEEAQSNTGDGNESIVEENKSETKKKAKEAVLEDLDSVKNQIEYKSCSKVSEQSEIVLESLIQTPPPSPPPGNATQQQPSALPMAAGKGLAAPPPPPPGNAALQPPSPLPMTAEKGSAAPPHPPPRKVAVPPPPPFPMAAGKGQGATPPPPPKAPLPMAAGKGMSVPPPPPPPGMRGARKAISKLKRSAQLCNLYKILRAKLEGKNQEARSHGGGKGGIGGAPDSGKKGMADALAEITKKSPYFQKIEADVQMYMKSINELKTEICKFQSKDISELQKFHHHVESLLEKLEDETKVLARCEGFPQSKLEAIRMAAALYSKLNGMIKELKNWKIESPADQLFDKTERYFAKIRREIETLDRTKTEEEKKFKSNNIHFDFNILVQIKESMVDISSGCMELALKEKREAKIALHTAEARGAKQSMKNKTVGWAKTLWRAFQFAYRVYTFAGGHDDRADQLTREVADEIKSII